MYKAGLIFFMLLSSVVALAQRVNEDSDKGMITGDTTAIDRRQVIDVMDFDMLYKSPVNMVSPLEDKPYSLFGREIKPLMPEINPKAYSFSVPTLQAPTLEWNNGYVMANGMMINNPGLVDISTGNIMASQNWDRLRVVVGVEANKYNFVWPGSVRTQYGVSGMLTYSLSDMVSLTAFGSYYFSPLYANPALMPYVMNNVYGGYATVFYSKNVGTNFGIKRYVNPMTGRWETAPIVRPFFKVGKVKMELELGDLLRDFIIYQVNKKKGPQGPMLVPKK